MENKIINESNLEELINLVDRNVRRASILITLNAEDIDTGGLIMDKSLSETQYVIATGPLVTDIKVGDKVDLNISALTKLRRLTNSEEVLSEIDIKTIELGDYVVGQVDERVVESIYKK